MTSQPQDAADLPAPASPAPAAPANAPQKALIDRLGGRKFVFAFAALLMAFILVLTGHFTAEQLLGAIQWVAVAFGAGNGLEHVGKGLGMRGVAK